MVFICVICMVKRPPLEPLVMGDRQILEALISPTLNLKGLGGTLLLTCINCLQMIKTVAAFRDNAIAGVEHLMSLLASVQATLAGEEPDPLLLEIKFEPTDNLVQVQPYVEMDHQEPLQQEKLQLTTELDIKMEPMAEEPDCRTEIDDIPLNVANTTAVNSCQTVPTPSTPATVEREETVAVFTHRPAEVRAGNPSVSGLLSPGDVGNTIRIETHQQRKTPRERPSSSSGHVRAHEEQNKKEPDRVKVKKRRVRKPPGPYKCEQCATRYVDEDKLKRHQERMHSTPEDPYFCKICNKQYKTKVSKKNHIKMHQIQKERRMGSFPPHLNCTECEKQFYTRFSLRNHMLCAHTDREKWKFECDICGSKFPDKGRVYMHIQDKHLTKKHRCKQCQYSFSKPSELRRHAATHLPAAARRAPHVCHLCAKAFTAKNSLTEHLSMHAGLRPHACPLCPATFTYSAALYTHNRLKHLKIKGNWTKGKKKTEEKSAV